MPMKMTGRLLATALLSITAGCQGGASQAPGNENPGTQKAGAEQCLERFDGITNCALGDAKLTPTEEGIQVEGLTEGEGNGISGTFPAATGWTQNIMMQLGAEGRFTMAARSGDQVVGTLQLRPGEEPGSMAILPSFSGAPGGSSYRLNVYRDGELLGGSNQPPRNEIYVHHYDIYYPVWYSNGFENLRVGPTPGACVWSLQNERGTFSVTLDDGTELTGDRLEFVEQIEDGHYPYTDFTSIDVTATAERFLVLNETFVPAEK
jgi:hypothetical protein